MRVYGLTKLGKRIVKARTGEDSEIKVLQYLQENKTGTENELGGVGGEHWVLSGLKRRGLIVELTT